VGGKSPIWGTLSKRGGMMGIKATWETTCTGCGKVEIKVIELGPETNHLSYYDIWGPGWPDD